MGFKSPDGSGLDHGLLLGLLDDDHTQYALLAGRAGTNDFTGQVSVTGNFTEAFDVWIRSRDSAGTGFINLIKTTGGGGVVVVGAGEGTDGTIWLGSASLNSADSINGDVIIGYGNRYRSTDSDNDFTRKLIGLDTIGAQADVVVLGDNALTFAVGAPAVVTNTPGGSMAFANARGTRGCNVAGNDTFNLAHVDSSDHLQLGDSNTPVTNLYGTIGVGIATPTAQVTIKKASDGDILDGYIGAAQRMLVTIDSNYTYFRSPNNRLKVWDYTSKGITIYDGNLLVDQKINASGLPTSAAGLAAGDLWVDTTGGNNIVKRV